MMLSCCSTYRVFLQFPSNAGEQIWNIRLDPVLHFRFLKSSLTARQKVRRISPVSNRHYPNDIDKTGSLGKRKSMKVIQKTGMKEHHLWQKRDSTRSGQKALNLVRNISGLPNEKEAVYGALDKWIAWEAEFPVIAAAKALKILRKRKEWVRVIQVAKWMLSKGQGATMATYDVLLSAFDMECRIDEAERLWDMILRTTTRSTSKKLFSRMILLYYHHNMPDKVIEVFADMEELGVKPDEDSVNKIAQAFATIGQTAEKKLVLNRYQGKWKFIHFNGERVRVTRVQLG